MEVKLSRDFHFHAKGWYLNNFYNLFYIFRVKFALLRLESLAESLIQKQF